MLRAGACQLTLATKSPLASVIVNGAAPPVASMPPWQPAQLRPPSAVAANMLRAPLDGHAVEGGLVALVAGRLTQPVEGQADRDEHDGAEADGQVAGEHRALEDLVGVVRHPVGRQLQLRADLGTVADGC